MTSITATHQVQVPATCSIEHKAFSLSNGIRLVVITDPKTNISATGASVFCGSHHDPVETPGLAHLQEHMLFLGTKRDPEEGGFDKFLSKNSGHSNAWTEDEVTNYYYQCSNSAFEEALVRFSHFFVEPTMTPSALEREVQAVHSEDEKNHPVDYWCFQEVLKERLVDKQHPHSRYGNGNAATLWDGPKAQGVNLHEVLMNFYQRHYVSENMVVAVYSRLNSDQVLSILEPILRNVRSGGAESRNVHHFPNVPRLISNESLGSWVNIKTNSNSQKIVIMFPMRTNKADTERYNSLHFCSWLLGHECKGTVVDVLRSEDLCTSLSTGDSEIDDENSLFMLDVGLSAFGLKHLDRVIDLVFEGIEYFRTQVGADKNLFDEMTASDHLRFNMSEVKNPSSHVSNIARNCNVYGPERCWSTVSLVTEMKPEEIQNALSVMTPQNAIFVLHLQDPDKIIRNSTGEKDEEKKSNEDGAQNNDDEEAEEEQDDQDEEGDDEEEEGSASGELKTIPVNIIKACASKVTSTSTHHKAKYSVTPIEPSLLQHWGRSRSSNGGSFHKGFKRPSANPFISSEFDVQTKEGEDGRTWATSVVPNIVRESRWGRVMWRPDAGHFNTPKGCVVLNLESPVAYSTPKHRVFTRILSIVLQYALAELTYFGELGSYKVTIDSDGRGLNFVVMGPRHKLMIVVNALLDAVFEEILNGATVANEEKYKACADRVLRSYQSLKVNAPYNQAVEWLYQYQYECRYHWSELLDSIKDTIPPFAEFLDFARNKLFSGRVRYDLLVAGNVVSKDAVTLGADIVEKIIENKLPNTVTPASDDDFKYQSNVIPPPSRAELSGSEEKDNNKSYFGSFIMKQSSNPQDTNSACVVSFYHGPSNPLTMALSDVVGNLLKAHYFEGLRTRETIGYIVGLSNASSDGHRFTRLTAQSAKMSAWYIFSRTYAFLNAARGQVFGSDMMDRRRKRNEADGKTEEFKNKTVDDYLNEQVREAAGSIAAECRDKVKNLSALAQRIWDLRHNPFGFNILEEEAQILDDATKVNAETVKQYFEEHFLLSEGAKVLACLVDQTEKNVADAAFTDIVVGATTDKSSGLLKPMQAKLPERQGDVPPVKEDDVTTLDLESFNNETVVVSFMKLSEDREAWRASRK